MANDSKQTQTSPVKNLIFWVVTIAFPFILLALVELGLRIGGYNEEARDLFIELPNNPEYLAPNPAFSTRYFPAFQPQIAPNIFLKDKEPNTFRVFVFGGSSTQGFPYNFYNAFSGRLEEMLLMNTKDINVEVINLGMTAVNSYVVWDLSSRVLEYEPDAVVIYAGHNEFYGSFGVGSSQFGLGTNIGLKRTIIRLKDLSLFQLIENMMKKEMPDAKKRTMMARVVAESSIERGGELYNAGAEQFRENMKDVVSLFSENNIPVYIGTLASKLKDQKPLSDNEESMAAYQAGMKAMNEGIIEEAYEKFMESKELDQIRFRAPEIMNEIIRELSETYDLNLVDIQKVAGDSSISGIPDQSFFTDHLHPNARGNQIIGEQFFYKIAENEPVSSHYVDNELNIRPEISTFEKAFSDIPIVRLTSGYPFIKGLSEREEYENFDRQYRQRMKESYVDSIGVTAWRNNRQITLALADAVNYTSRVGDTVSVAQHYYELANWQILNDKLLKKGVNYSINRRDLDNYNALMLEKILSVKRDDAYFANSLSAIYLLHQDLENAEPWLKTAEDIAPEMPEMLYNYARYFVLSGDTIAARDYYQKYMNAVRKN